VLCSWDGSLVACQIYCGKLPKDLFEDSLIPLFENIGSIWDLRLMMDPISGRNRGYCFVTFTEKKAAEEAVRQVTTGVFFNCQIQITVFLVGQSQCGWWRGTVVERRSLAGELSLSCARPAADG